MGVICSCNNPTEKLKHNFSQQHASTFPTIISVKPLFVAESAQQELHSYLGKHKDEMSAQVRDLFTSASTDIYSGLTNLVLQKVRPEDWIHLSTLFVYGDCVERLVLSSTRLDATGFYALCGYLEVLGSLSELRLVDMYLGSCDFRRLVTSFKKLKRLVRLDLSKNSLNATHMRLFTPIVSKLTFLRELNLDDNCIEDEGCELLRPRLYPLRSLRIVSLRFNSITPEGYLQFRELLQSKENLRIVVDGLKLDK